MEDNEIIELFFSRSEQAIVELSCKYGLLCKKVSFNILKNMQDVEECLNDTYLGVWNAIPPNRPDSLVTYVCKIVRNLSLKRLRYNTAQKRNNYYDLSLSELEECFLIDSSNHQASYDTEQLTMVIEKFLDSLDQKSRVMFIKRYWYLDSISSIAKEFEMKENNVTVKLLRIKNKMKKFLEKEKVRL